MSCRREDGMLRCFGTMTTGAAFGEATVEAVWQRGKPLPGLATLRADICGASMQRDKYGMEVPYGWEIDHIRPVSQGGKDDLTNLQPLQWENNRHKSDNWPEWQCKKMS
jgi:hypothetical protein